MAFIDSIKSYQVSLANIEAGVYEDFSFKMARYESESASEVFLRIISFLHSYDAGRKLINKDGFWYVEEVDPPSEHSLIAMIGLPDWKVVDHEVKRIISAKGQRTSQLSIYLTNPEDYQQLLSRVKSRKLNGIEALNIFTVNLNTDNSIDGMLADNFAEDEAIIRADSWDVLIIDGHLVQLSIKNKTATHQLSVNVDKRDVWADYQALLKELSQVAG